MKQMFYEDNMFGTLPFTRSADNLIKVYEAEGRDRIWLQDVLEDRDIPYRIEVLPYWTGIKVTEFHEKQLVYVEPAHEREVCGYIDEYNDLSNAVPQEAGDYLENGIPQIICSSCGKDIDFDYPRCPFCNHEIKY